MTVKELRRLLALAEDDMEVMVEREGEHRTLEEGDVLVADQVSDAESGDVHDGKFLVITTWS